MHVHVLSVVILKEFPECLILDLTTGVRTTKEANVIRGLRQKLGKQARKIKGMQARYDLIISHLGTQRTPLIE